MLAGAVLLYLSVGNPLVPDFSRAEQQEILTDALAQEGIEKENLEQALANLRQTLEPDDALGALMLARGYRLLGEPTNAEQILLITLETHPKDVELLKELGRLKLAQTQYKAAFGIFGRVLALNPQDEEAATFAATAKHLGNL